MIRNRLGRNEFGQTIPEEDETLSRVLYLRRPDGTSWGVTWDQTVVWRLKGAIATRVRRALDVGLAVEGNCGVTEWRDWARGFLHPAWDGMALDEAYGRQLLDDAGHPDHGDHNTPDVRPEAAREPLVEPKLQPQPEPEPEPEPEPGFEQDGPCGPWSAVAPPSSMPGDELSTIGPDDSASQIGTRRFRRLPHASHSRVLTSIAEDESAEQDDGLLGSRVNGNERGPMDHDNSQDDDMAWWRSQPLDYLWSRLWQTQRQVWMVREYAVCLFLDDTAQPGGNGRIVREEYEEARAQRDVWFEELCFLDELIDLKLQEKHQVKIHNQNTGLRYPVSGLVWRYFLWPGEKSPVLEEAVLRKSR